MYLSAPVWVWTGQSWMSSEHARPATIAPQLVGDEGDSAADGYDAGCFESRPMSSMTLGVGAAG